jgi:hypothetical protein
MTDWAAALDCSAAVVLRGTGGWPAVNAQSQHGPGIGSTSLSSCRAAGGLDSEFMTGGDKLSHWLTAGSDEEVRIARVALAQQIGRESPRDLRGCPPHVFRWPDHPYASVQSLILARHAHLSFSCVASPDACLISRFGLALHIQSHDPASMLHVVKQVMAACDGASDGRLRQQGCNRPWLRLPTEGWSRSGAAISSRCGPRLLTHEDEFHKTRDSHPAASSRLTNFFLSVEPENLV